MRRTIIDVWVATAICIGLVFVYGALARAQPVELLANANADQLFNTPAGNYVRIIGGKPLVDAPVLPSPIGDAVNVPSVPPDALCNVVLDALPVEVLDPETGKVVRVVPGVPELAHAFGDASWPIRMEGSEGDVGNWYWNALFRGAACVTSADSSSYVMSSLQELFPLIGKPPWKCRILRAQITETRQINGQDVEVNITVSACDSRVNPAQDRIFIGHSWSGRWGDLNFRRFKAGVFSDRVQSGGK